MADTISMLLSSGIMIMMWTYLYKENPIYKISEAILIGTSAGFYTIVGFQSIYKGNIVQLLQGDLSQIVGFVLLVLLFCTFIPNLRWLSRIPMTFLIIVSMSVTAAGSIPATFIGQSVATFTSLTDINGVIKALAVLTVLFYFIFSIEHKGTAGGVARVGRLFLIAGLGGQYSYFVTTRITRWLNGLNLYVLPYPAWYSIFPVVAALIIWAFMTKDKIATQ
jgi:hypothetical protein